MAKHKEVKKASKAEPKSKKPSKREDVEVSDGTQAIIRLAKKTAGATAEQTVPGVIRVYRGNFPILKITGITKETPNVFIRPKLRGSDFKTETGGLVEKGNWKESGSKYLYIGDSAKLEKKLSIFLKHVTAEAKA